MNKVYAVNMHVVGGILLAAVLCGALAFAEGVRPTPANTPMSCVEFSSTDVHKPIDAFVGITNSTLTINDPLTASNMSVVLDISYPYVMDLIVNLRSPLGTEITLLSNLPLWGANFTNTELRDDAALPIGSGVAPFTGCYIPQSSLEAAFGGANAQGTWTLRIQTIDTFDTGVLNGWKLRFGCPCGSEPEEGEGEPEGEPEGEAPPPGVYIVGPPLVEYGTEVTLRAVVSPDIAYTEIRWFRDGGLISGAIGLEYHILEVDFDHEGVYHVEVKDAEENWIPSPPFRLRVAGEGMLSVSSLAALGALTVLLSWAGARRHRPRR